MSAEFIAEEGVLKGLILSLDKGEEWSIGRDPEQVTFVIEDPKVSRVHLVCRQTDQGYVIENFSETNPVLVNGESFTGERVLSEGDRITIGETIFHFYPEVSPGTYTFKPVTEFDSDESLLEEPLPPEKEDEELAVHEEEDVPFFPSTEEEQPEEELEREEIFQEVEDPGMTIDLTPSSRFIIKVIAGPNTGAEFALDFDRQYLIGTDSTTCDLIFNDLSVSREHARLSVGKEGEVVIEDLGSRNGVIVDKERLKAPKALVPNAVVALGTSVFLFIDRDAPSETVVAPIFEAPLEEEQERREEKGADQKKETVSAHARKTTRPFVPTGALILSLIISGLAVLFGIGMVSLLHTKEVVVDQKDYLAEIQDIVKDYPAVRFTYNPSSGKLFLLGHVETGVQLSELLYKLRGLAFIHEVENNVINDEAVWQEMNILLSKIPDFKGVSMHSPEAGVFVISGYLQTEKQASNLIDYLNINFNYLNLLQNRVVVEQEIAEEVAAHLVQQGFAAVTPVFSTGELVLTGYVSSTQTDEFDNLVDSFMTIPGVRSIKNFVVTVSPELGVIDLNKRYPGKFRVTGFSKHGDVNINVVINGRILTRGDQIDGMIITSIQPNTIFLEKDGLKYKIDYNK